MLKTSSNKNLTDKIFMNKPLRKNNRLADIQYARSSFPALNQSVNGHPLVYFDNAATTHKPFSVLSSIDRFYSTYNSNVHRGVHSLSEQATDQYEKARKTIQGFINAESEQEIIFVKGTTEAINLVAQTFGRSNIKAGDEILITAMEHHSNIVPWQILADQNGCKLNIIPINEKGELVLDDLDDLLTPYTKLVSLVHISNSLGTINPIETIIKKAHLKNIPVLVDAAQSIQHGTIDVQKLDCDFLAFSGHKIYGPTGIGVLYGKKKLLEEMPPYQGGGDMINYVSFEKTTYNELPYKFEAGTPNISGGIGLGAAIEFFQYYSIKSIIEKEQALLNYGKRKLLEVPGLTFIGTADKKTAVFSFVLKDIHPHDVGTILNQYGIAVRTGHHCTQPVMTYYQIPATVRASLVFYNTESEIDFLVEKLHAVNEVFK
jgi:cysteine desulfurase / selenocysteine lyase